MPAWIVACLLAPFMGSFAGVVIMRHDAIGSALAGRSCCTSCKTRLGVRDLFPVLSWVLLRGRCRHCSASVAPFYPAVELAALAVAVWASLLTEGNLLWVSCALGWVLLTLAVTDLKYFRLPDFLTLLLIAAGLLANAAQDFSLFWNYVLGAIAGYAFVIGLRFIYRHLRGREGMGLGDAKLLAAAGAWVSWSGLPSVVLIGSLLGLVAVLVLAARGGKIDLSARIPFGVFLSLGLWIVWLYGPLTAG